MKTPEQSKMVPPVPPVALVPGAAGCRGFTILEIMIATAILTLGLVGILALFPVAIHTGKQIMETTTAAVIAESVADAIQEGIRNDSRYVNRNGVTHTYFVFKHDGVTDRIPRRRRLERPSDDYYILLPRFKRAQAFRSREAAAVSSKTFLYPEDDRVPNGGGNAFLADDDGDDERTSLPGGEVVTDVRVDKVYHLGRFLPGKDTPDAQNVLDDQKIEILKQYSYAFSIRASEGDVDLSPSRRLFVPGNRLYSVRIMVFRGFMPAGPDARPPDPVFELDFEVSA